MQINLHTLFPILIYLTITYWYYSYYKMYYEMKFQGLQLKRSVLQMRLKRIIIASKQWKFYKVTRISIILLHNKQLLGSYIWDIWILNLIIFYIYVYALCTLHVIYLVILAAQPIRLIIKSFLSAQVQLNSFISMMPSILPYSDVMLF